MDVKIAATRAELIVAVADNRKLRRCGGRPNAGEMSMRKTGDERLSFHRWDIEVSFRNFCSWRFSDLLDNMLCGSFSEFVETAA